MAAVSAATERWATKATLRSHSEKWTVALNLQQHQVETQYDTYVWKEIKQPVAERISQRLGLSRAEAGGGPSAATSEQQLPLRHPCYRPRQGRERLRRLLITVEKWKEGLGEEPGFGVFCAAMMAVLETERLAFRAVATLHARLRLDDYFSPAPAEGSEASRKTGHGCGRRSALEEDCAQLWLDLLTTWPEVASAFSRHGREDLFFKLVSAWLPSLFTMSLDLKRQPFTEFLPLFDRLLAPDRHCASDPRRGLRRLALAALGRHRRRLRAAASRSADALVAEAARLATRLPVDAELLEIIDKQDPEPAGWWPSIWK